MKANVYRINTKDQIQYDAQHINNWFVITELQSFIIKLHKLHKRALLGQYAKSTSSGTCVRDGRTIFSAEHFTPLSARRTDLRAGDIITSVPASSLQRRHGLVEYHRKTNRKALSPGSLVPRPCQLSVTCSMEKWEELVSFSNEYDVVDK